MCAVEGDELLRGAVLLCKCLVVVEGRGDLLCKLLAKLDAPLVERVDAPDRALGERDVLIEGNELAKCMRRQRLAEVRRAIGDGILVRASVRDLGETVGQGFRVLPKARAFVCARKLPRKSSWMSWSPSFVGFGVFTKAMKSAGIRRVP